MLVAMKAKDPAVRSYFTLRKAVGVVALGLPFALAIPWWALRGHIIEPSVSSYYYTGMRNLFVGSLCAISMFQLCCRGYDRKDEIAGIFSGVCALGVAFFPTEPNCGATPRQQHIAVAHYIFATLLFSTLAYFCLVLFKMTAQNRTMTRKKLERNRVYTVCGHAILTSMALIALLKLLAVLHVSLVEDLVANFHTTFCFESTALIAFGVAWLIKGEAFLKDEEPGSAGTADGM
jgi:hypothetical protein